MRSQTAIEGKKCFFQSESTGQILPGTSQIVTFRFTPREVGIFGDEWELRISPEQHGAPPRLRLHGVCVKKQDPLRLYRRELEADLEQRQTVQVQRLLRSLPLPCTTPGLGCYLTLDSL